MYPGNRRPAIPSVCDGDAGACASRHPAGNQAFNWFGTSKPVFFDAGSLWSDTVDGVTTIFGKTNGDSAADFAVTVDFQAGTTKLWRSDFNL